MQTVLLKRSKTAEQARHAIIDYIKVDPYFDFLRSDPRYAELLARLKPPGSYFGVRRQSEATTALWIGHLSIIHCRLQTRRAFARFLDGVIRDEGVLTGPIQSGVALRLCTHSK